MINNNHYFDPAEMARNAMSSLLTLFHHIWRLSDLRGVKSRIWTPSIWEIQGLDPSDPEDLRIWTPSIWRISGSGPLRSGDLTDPGYPILGGPLKHPELAYLRVFSLFH